MKRLDLLLTRLEVALAVAAVAALVSSLLAWVLLKGLATAPDAETGAGLLTRLSLAGGLFAALAAGATRKTGPKVARAAIAAALALGLGLGFLLRGVGVAWGTNVLGWLQDGSALTLVGGLRGLGTRLTLALAMLGGALATASGRHVAIDVVTRSLEEPLRKPLAVAGGLVMAAVCLASAWGFFDFAAQEAFGAPAQASAQEKAQAVGKGVARHAFLLREQLAIDAAVAIDVLGGARWDTAYSARAWNWRLLQPGWAEHFTAEQREKLVDADLEASRAPLVATPGEATRGLLVKSLNLVIAWGLAWMAARALLWCARGAPVEGAHGAPEARGEVAP